MHTEAIARLIESLNNYSDPEYPCDTMAAGGFGEPLASCDTGEHTEPEIIARWRASHITKRGSVLMTS
jgi:hypothetical protein